jgi:hypothetical protein
MSISSLNEPQFRRHLSALLIVLLSTAVTCHLLISVAAGEWGTVALWGMGLALLGWVFFARDAWWLLLPMAIGFGGMFYFGFKVYTHEIMLVVCFLPLLPQLAAGRSLEVRRKKLPVAFYALIAYLGMHMLVSGYLAMMDGESIGSIIRVYVAGLWPLIFAIPFYSMGSSRYLRRALTFFLWAAMIRSILGVIGYYFPQAIIPVMGFILPGLYSEGMELRESGLWMVYLGFTLFSLSPRWISKAFYALLVAAAGWFVVLGGGRGSLAMAVGISIVWATFEKKFISLAIFVAGLMALLVTFNSDPDLIYQFPKRLQRTLSVFVLKSPYQTVHVMLETSDQWHYELMQRGYNKWVKTPITCLLGNPVLPVKNAADFGRKDFYDKMQMAEDLAAYESGLWTVLATLGLVGMVLYIVVFSYFLGPVIRSLWHHQICDPAHAFAFMAVASMMVWVGFCWGVGHFPSQQLMLAVIARAAYDDQQEEAPCAS